MGCVRACRRCCEEDAGVDAPPQAARLAAIMAAAVPAAILCANNRHCDDTGQNPMVLIRAIVAAVTDREYPEPGDTVTGPLRAGAR
jgi:hypothetical protein